MVDPDWVIRLLSGSRRTREALPKWGHNATDQLNATAPDAALDAIDYRFGA